LARSGCRRNTRPSELAQFCQFPDSEEDDFLSRGWSERVSAMIRKVSRVEIVVPTALAVALVIMLSIGAVYLAEQFLRPIERVGGTDCPSVLCGESSPIEPGLMVEAR
jgi:hypothetical protein